MKTLFKPAIEVLIVLRIPIQDRSRRTAAERPLQGVSRAANTADCHAITDWLSFAGLNNDFLIKTHNDLALTYNDISPLEMFHSAASAKVLRTHRFMEVGPCNCPCSGFLNFLFLLKLSAGSSASSFLEDADEPAACRSVSMTEFYCHAESANPEQACFAVNYCRADPGD